MPKRKEMFQTKDENIKHRAFDLNECATSPDANLQIHSEGVKTGMNQVNVLQNANYCEYTGSLVDGGVERIQTGNMENVINMRRKKAVKLKLPDREVLITGRVLRSNSAARDTGQRQSDQNHGAVEEKCRGTEKGELSKGYKMSKVSGRSSGGMVEKEVKHGHGKSLVTKETSGGVLRSQPKVENMDDRSGDENGTFELHEEKLEVKRKRGRPRKLQISSQSDESCLILNCKPERSLYDVEVKHEHGESLVAKETNGDDIRSQTKVESRDDRSGDENGTFEPHKEELEVKRKRGRPRKLQISSQSDESGSILNCKPGISLYDKEKAINGDNNEKFIGRSSFDEAKREVNHEHELSAEAKKILGSGFRSPIKLESEDGRSCDENSTVEKHDKEPQFKQKSGRPRKLKISSQSEDSGSNTNCKLARTPDLRSQPNVDRPNMKRQRGRPPKTPETSVGPYIRDEIDNFKQGSTLKMPDQIMSDSIGETKRPKSNYGGSPQGPESDGGKCRGRNMVRKRGRPPKSKKERSSWGADESGSEATKRLKLCASSSESRDNNPLVDGGRKNVQLQTKQDEVGTLSRSESKKILRDQILQLLLAAGWRIEYRPRNGSEYNDAVYINPEGKTHWSITLAYKVYKEHLDSCSNDQMNSTTGSGFALLPEGELHILSRKTLRDRGDKGMRRSKWNGRDTNENMVSRKGIGKRRLHVRKLQTEKRRVQKLNQARLNKKKQKGFHVSPNLGRISMSVKKIKREERHNRKRCAPLARSSLKDADSMDDGYILYEGKRSMLSWMIDSEIVPLNGKVQCMNCRKTKVLLEGVITKEGIQCNCCSEVLSIFDFDVHAGGKRNKPFKSLYLECGNSLLQCLLEFWKKQSESQLNGFHFVDFDGGDPNDDTCGICGDGGDLICCDGCPSTFHKSCLGIEKFPSGAWFCCYCSCKFCKKVEAAKLDTAALSPLLSCCLCEEKYHQACIKQSVTMPGDSSTRSFCGKHCQELFERLQPFIGVKQPLPDGFSWTFLRRFGLPHELSEEVSDKIVYNAELAVAFSVMDECFSPLVDHRSGVNLLQNIVYNFGSNFQRLNYSNFLTAVLERGDEFIAVASIRIHGNQLAEMPFIGTRYMYRRQGMCRRLMAGIESALSSLEVEKLVIPAVPELTDTWTSGFGFRAIHESDKKTIKNLNLLVFPGVDMLEKSMLKDEIDGANMSSSNEGDNDTKSNAKLLNCQLEERDEMGKMTDKDAESLPDVVNSCIGYRNDAERQENGVLEDNMRISVDDFGGKNGGEVYSLEAKERSALHQTDSRNTEKITGETKVHRYEVRIA